MRVARLDTGRWCLVFATGDPVMTPLAEFASEQGIEAASFQAIGAFEEATIAFFDVATKAYRDIPVLEQVEVSALLGNLSMAPDGSHRVHAHVTLGREDGSALAGHLVEARVRPTLELFLDVYPRPLRRRVDEATGLALLHLEPEG